MSVAFIHKVSVTMHGRTILKYIILNLILFKFCHHLHKKASPILKYFHFPYNFQADFTKYPNQIHMKVKNKNDRKFKVCEDTHVTIDFK